MFRACKPGVVRDSNTKVKEPSSYIPIPQAIFPIPDTTISEKEENDKSLQQKQSDIQASNTNSENSQFPSEHTETETDEKYVTEQPPQDIPFQNQNLDLEEDDEESDEDLVREVREDRKITPQFDPLITQALQMFSSSDDEN